MLLLIGALTIGLILSLLALGVFISFRIFAFPDITADGSITLGAAVAACCSSAHVHPLARHCGGVRRRRAGRRDDRRAAHAIQDQRAAVRHPGDDRALLGQPAHHGEEQLPLLVRADAGHRWPNSGAQCGRRHGDASTCPAGRSSTRDAAVLVLALWRRGRRSARCSISSSGRTSAPRCGPRATTRR